MSAILRCHEHISRLYRARDGPRREVRIAEFKKVNVNIPSRTSYKGSYGKKFWAKFTKCEVSKRPESWISSSKLRELADEILYEDRREVEKAAKILEDGADLGCKGSARLPTRQRNAESCYEFGERVLDSLEDWLQQGIAAGPLTKKEVKHHLGPDYTVNPISVRLKPNGKARIIVNMSAPHVKDKKKLDLASGIPSSVNSGIDKEDWPAYMAGTKEVLELIHLKGQGCKFCKSDWTSAYKHIFVRTEDLHLQVLEIGGRYFVEKALVFGCVSSPGIYDFVAKLVIKLAAARVGTAPADILQCLDDVVMVAHKDSKDCEEFYLSYRQTCEEVGVRLAPEGDKDKAFPPTSEGTILGIEYDTEAWKWRMPEAKASYMLETLYKVIDGTPVTNEEILKLVGRLQHYHRLVEGGKQERMWLTCLGDSLGSPARLVEPCPVAVSQARWWAINIPSSLEWSAIPDPRELFPSQYVSLFPDAAGGSDTDIKLGFGGCVWLEEDPLPWCYLAWSELIRTNRKNRDGVAFARKLSTLEAVAALGLLASEPALLKNKAVRIFSDNQGFVTAYRKAYTPDPYLMTAVMAINNVARGLNINLDVQWSPRRSGVGEEIADDLSKGKLLGLADRVKTRMRTNPSYIPKTLVTWLEHPTASRVLGQAMLDEMSHYVEVLRWNLEEISEVQVVTRRGRRRREE